MSETESANACVSYNQFSQAMNGSESSAVESDLEATTSKYFRQEQQPKSKTFEKAGHFYVVTFNPTLKHGLTREEVFEHLKPRCRGLIVAKEVNHYLEADDGCPVTILCLIHAKDAVREQLEKSDTVPYIY